MIDIVGTHVMLDLETLGTEPGCAVVSVGACVFSAHGIGPTFYDAAVMDDTLLGSTSPATLAFWLRQGDAARGALLKGRVKQADVLAAFSHWWRQVGGNYVWSHGEAFDIPVLEAAYRLHGMNAPWHYRAGRDTRTLMDVAGARMPAMDASDGVQHHALHDAVHQARHCLAALKTLRVPGWFVPDAPGAEIKADMSATTGDGEA